MSRPSQMEISYVQTFVHSKFFVRSTCVRKYSCPDFRLFKIAYIQTVMRSKRKFVRSQIDNLCVHVQTIVRSKYPMSRRLSCVQKKPVSRVSCVPNQNSCGLKLIICTFISRLSRVQKNLCLEFCVIKVAYV